jgi:hypothetical protein
MSKKLPSERLNANSNCSSDTHLAINGIWVQALLGPLLLGVKTDPLCPMTYY